MNSLSCSLYIDSENNEKQLLAHLRQTSSIDIKHVFKSAIELVENMNNKPIDILFISKSLEQVLTYIRQPPFIIGIDGEEQNCISNWNHLYFDSLTYPIEEQNLCNTLGKLFKIANTYRTQASKAYLAAENEAIYHAQAPTQDLDHIFIKNGSKSLKLFYNEILYVKNVGNHVQIFLENKKPVFHRSTLKKFFESLPMNSFARINKSVIVNFKKIDGFQKQYVWIQQEKFSVSRIYIVRLRELLRLLGQ